MSSLQEHIARHERAEGGNTEGVLERAHAIYTRAYEVAFRESGYRPGSHCIKAGVDAAVRWAREQALTDARKIVDGPHPANSGLDSFTLAHVSAAIDNLKGEGPWPTTASSN